MIKKQFLIFIFLFVSSWVQAEQNNENMSIQSKTNEQELSLDNVGDSTRAAVQAAQEMTLQEEKSQDLSDNITLKNDEQKTRASTLEENQIPVLAQEGSTQKMDERSPTKLLVAVLALLIAGVMSVLFIKRNSQKQNKQNALMNIKIITQFHLGPKKSLAVIRVAGESILIGVTDQNINMIKSLSLLDEDVPEIDNQDFKATLNTAFTSEDKLKINKKNFSINNPVTHKQNFQTQNTEELDFLPDIEINDKTTFTQSSSEVSDLQQYEPEEFSFGNMRRNILNKMKQMRDLS